MKLSGYLSRLREFVGNLGRFVRFYCCKIDKSCTDEYQRYRRSIEVLSKYEERM